MLLKWPCWHLWFCLNWSIKINGIFLIVVLQKVIRGFNNCVYSNKNDILNLLQLFSFILLLCEHLYFHPRIWFVQRIFLQKGLSLYHRCDLIVNVGLTRSIPVFNVLAWDCFVAFYRFCRAAILLGIITRIYICLWENENKDAAFRNFYLNSAVYCYWHIF